MVWTSWSQFFAMGGYGVYVWGSFVFCLCCIILEGVLLRMAQARARKYILRKQQLRDLKTSANDVRAERIAAGAQQ